MNKMKMYVLDSNDARGIDNKYLGIRDLRDNLFSEMVEVNKEVDLITLNGKEERIYHLIQELEDVRTQVNSFLYNIKYNYNAELDMEHERHNMKLKMRDWTPAGYYECEFKEANSID